MTIPYTYCLTHNPSGRRYYGSRYAKNCKPEDLWISYFTSSTIIKKLIETDGKSAFSFEIRKVFDTKVAALTWEQKVLCRLKVTKNEKWINESYFSKDKIVSIISDARNEKISEALRGRKNGPMSAETKDKISAANSGRKLPPRTPEHCENISAANKGRKMPRRSKEHCEKISTTERKPYPPRTPEHLQKIKDAKTGMKYKKKPK